MDKLGDCYQVAGRLIMDSDGDAILVHGIVAGHGPLKGMWIGHAWVEIGDVVLDHSNNKQRILRKEEYYRVGKINVTRKYTKMEASKMMLKHKHYGPWDSIVTTDWQRQRRQSG